MLMQVDVVVALRKAGRGLGFHVYRMELPCLPLIEAVGETPYFGQPHLGAKLYTTKETTLTKAIAEVETLGLGLVAQTRTVNRISAHAPALAV